MPAWWHRVMVRRVNNALRKNRPGALRCRPRRLLRIVTDMLRKNRPGVTR
jgi:hypothetical protein